jgi:hypothetical protein
MLMAIIIVLYLAAWIPGVFAGRRLGSRWGNPEAGLWLPAILGPLGFAIFVSGSHPATQPGRSVYGQERRGIGRF